MRQVDLADLPTKARVNVHPSLPSLSSRPDSPTRSENVEEGGRRTTGRDEMSGPGSSGEDFFISGHYRTINSQIPDLPAPGTAGSVEKRARKESPKRERNGTERTGRRSNIVVAPSSTEAHVVRSRPVPSRPVPSRPVPSRRPIAAVVAVVKDERRKATLAPAVGGFSCPPKKLQKREKNDRRLRLSIAMMLHRALEEVLRISLEPTGARQRLWLRLDVLASMARE